MRSEYEQDGVHDGHRPRDAEAVKPKEDNLTSGQVVEGENMDENELLAIAAAIAGAIIGTVLGVVLVFIIFGAPR